MAKQLSLLGIKSGDVIEAEHVTQSIDAFTGAEAYDITVSGSLTMQGPLTGTPETLNSFSASYALTSSHALNALSSSYTITSSYSITSSYAQTASYAITSSYAVTSSYAITSSYAQTASYAITSSYAVTSSFAQTASYVATSSYTPTLQEVTTAGSSTSQDIQISGSLVVSASNQNQALQLYGSGSTIFSIEGSRGTLFSIDDDESDGKLFSVNNVSGTPVLEVHEDNTVKIGKQDGFGIVISGSNPLPSDNDAKILITGSIHNVGSTAYFNTNITASGNISSSGYISASSFNATPGTINELTASYAVTASHALTASYVKNAQTASYIDASNIKQPFTNLTSSNLLITGTASINLLYTTYESSSIIYSSGSTKFGDTFDDFHQFTGSISSTGSYVDFTGATGVSGSFSGSFAGNGSELTNIPASGITGLNLSRIASGSVTASIAPNKGFEVNTNITASGNISASGYISASEFVGLVTTAQTASFITGSNVYGPHGSNSVISSSHAITASHALNVATPTLQIVTNAGSDTTTPITASIISASSGITGSLLGTASTASYVETAQTASFVTLAQTASFVTTAQTASYVLNAVSSSYALTASYAVSASHEIIKEVSSSYADTASFAQSGNGIFSGSFSGSFAGDGSELTNIPASGITGLNLSRIASGSVTASIAPNKGFQVNTNTQITGSLILSGSTGNDLEVSNDALIKGGAIIEGADRTDPYLIIRNSGSGEDISAIQIQSQNPFASNPKPFEIAGEIRLENPTERGLKLRSLMSQSVGHGGVTDIHGVGLEMRPRFNNFGFYTTSRVELTRIGGDSLSLIDNFNVRVSQSRFYKDVQVDEDLDVQRNITSSGNISASGYISASEFVGLITTAQTASYVETAQTASYVTLAQTASYVETAQTASFVTLAQTASYVTTAQTASYVTTAQTASYVLNAISSSYALTASYAVSASHEIIKEVSSSYADTASFAQSGNGIFSGSFSGSFQGDGSQLTGISAGTNLTQSIFVTQNGDDTTGTIGDITKPFATLESASQAATTGSTIFVYPGTYTPTENLAREGVNYYFQPGTTVSSSYAGAIFDVEGFRTSPHGFNVYGNADFHFHTSNAASLWEAGAGGAEVTFDWTLEFQDVTTTSDATDNIIRLGGTGQTSRIKFRDATIQGTLIRNDASYTDSQKIKIEGNNFNSANGGFYSQGGNAGPAYMQVDMLYVYAGGSYAIAGIGYNTAVLFNIAYCSGAGGAYSFTPSGGYNQNSVINGYANKISISGPSDVTHNGDCDELVMSSGRYVGNSVKKFTLSGGESRFAINYQTNQANSVSVSGGVHTIEMVENQTNYEHIFGISGGKCILVGYNRSAFSNGRITVSGGELIFKGHIEYAYSQNGSGRQPFNVTGGLLRMQGYAKNRLTDSDPSPQEYSVIKYTGGDIILDGATLVVSSSIAPPIWAPNQSEEIKIYSGGVNTNKTGSMGLLAASSSFGSGGYALTNPLGGMIIEDANVE